MPTRSSRIVNAVSIVIAALLVAGLVGLAVHQDAEGGRVVQPTTIEVRPPSSDGAITTTTAPPGDAGELAALVADLQAFIEQARGLKYKAPVKVTLLDDKAFRQRLTEESKADEGEIEKAFKILRALDLIDADVDLEKARQALLGGAVLGYYDLEKKEMFVRGAEITPAVRQTLAHELVHALQDQHFDVHRPELEDQNDESGDGLTGLVEGDAVRIEQMYTKTMSARDQQRAIREQMSGVGDLDDVPQILLESLAFPYQVGPDFVESLFRQGGQARLDEAFRSPPLTTEHLLHPEAFFRGEKPAAVAEPPAEGTVIDRGVFGELGWRQQLQETIGNRVTVNRAAAGWGGDRYVAWEQGDKTCVRVDVVMDTPNDLNELRSGLQRFVDEHPGASLTGDSPMRFTSCA